MREVKRNLFLLESIRNELRLRTLQIIVLRQNKTDPRGIIERLIEERKQMKQNQEWSHKDSAWAVFDGDEHIEQSYANWKSAIDRANSQDIQLAITNPCFELRNRSPLAPLNKGGK